MANIGANFYIWKGVAVGIYLMKQGDRIARHQHPYEHTLCLVTGSGQFEIYGDGGGITDMELGHQYLLPANIDHEMRSLQDGTVMFAIADAQETKLPPVYTSQHGGILMDDGTLATHETD